MKATAGRYEKCDALVTVQRCSTPGTELNIESPVYNLFSENQYSAVKKVLEELECDRIRVDIKDNQALDFVIAARVRAAVYLLEKGDAE